MKQYTLVHICSVLSFKKKSQQKVEEGIKKLKHKLKTNRGPLEGQWSGLWASKAQGTGSIPGQGTKALHAAWPKNGCCFFF